MTERRGTKALELWCRRITDGYPGVNVQNMTTSWRDGLAFCAMIHHFRPDLIDFNSLNKDDVYGNNELAFRTAAEHLGIPALLDAEDMASCSVPDRLSILTYLSQFYQSFGGSSPSRLALSRTKESSNEGITPVVAESTTPKVGPRMGMRREPCAVCGMPVFLAEKLMISRTPYHRTCFRCARCANQLTPGNYYETEDGQYCCETCPDEEDDKSPILHQAYNNSVIIGHEKIFRIDSKESGGYQISMSDEEKTEQKAKMADEIMERVPNIEATLSPTRDMRGSLMAEKHSQSAQMRLNFITSHLLTEESVENSENSSLNEEEYSSDGAAERRKDSPSSSPGGSLWNRRGHEGSLIDRSIEDRRVDAAKMPFEFKNDRDSSTKITSLDIGRRSDDSNFAHSEMQKIDNLNDNVEDNEEIKIMREKMKNSFDTATEEATHVNNHNSYLDHKKISIRQDTKDKIGPDIDVDLSKRDDLNADASLSLVQRRLKMFENTKFNDITRDESRVDSSSRVNFKKRNSLVEKEKDEEINLLVERKKDDERNLFVERDKDEEINLPIEREKDEEINLSVEREKDEEINLSVEREKDEGRNEISEDKTRIEEDSKILKNSPEVESLMGEEKKTTEIIDSSFEISVKSIETPIKTDERFPPIVPKRSRLELRKAEKLGKEKSEVTVLNASGIDLSGEKNYPKDLNPFGSDEEENCEILEKSTSSRISTNPFGSSEDEDDESPRIIAPPRPAMRNISNTAEKKSEEEILEDVNEAPTKRRLKAPQINLNPFWSDDDDEDHDSEDEREDHSLNSNTPVPKPRTIKQTPDSFLSPWKNDLNRGEIYTSNSSLASTGSTSTPGGTYRKKKPAPPPPIAKELFASGVDSLQSPNSRHTYTGSNNSLRSTPRARKSKPAPPPPMPTSTPCSSDLMANLTLAESPIIDSGKIIESRDYEMWNDPKNGKDEANRNKQSMTTLLSNDEESPYDAYTDKSVQGKWKRKKGPAPARPIPHRRKIKVISPKDVKLELDEIEMQQQGLEKQGVRLEQLIRDKAETGNATEDTSLGMDVEELVLELFVLVNEKNELFRRQAELMLLRRQQRLEEEHADIEYQIRCLLCQPEATKTDFDKQREETLIQRLVEIVERRNEIVECLEMDRRREVEEDRSINTQMGIYAARNKADFAKELEDEENNRSRKSKKTKLKEKAKEKILRKGHKKDADKDVDETEVKLKRQNKRKWF